MSAPGGLAAAVTPALWLAGAPQACDAGLLAEAMVFTSTQPQCANQVRPSVRTRCTALCATGAEPQLPHFRSESHLF